MSDPVKTAEANVERFKRELLAHFNDVIPNAPEVVALIECLILAHIQKTVANMMGRTS